VFHCKLSDWAKTAGTNAAVGAAAGAASFGCGAAAGAACASCPALANAQALITGIVAGAGGGTAGKVVANLFQGNDLHDGLLTAMFSGAFSGALGAGISEKLTNEVSWVKHLCAGFASGAGGSFVSEIITSALSGDNWRCFMDFESALQNAIIGGVIGMISAGVACKEARKRAVNQLLNDPGTATMSGEHLARQEGVRIEVCEDGQLVNVWNKGGRRVDGSLQKQSGGQGRLGAITPLDKDGKPLDVGFHPPQDDFCLERAILKLARGKTPAQHEVYRAREHAKQKLKPELENMLDDLYPKFKESDRVGGDHEDYRAGNKRPALDDHHASSTAVRKNHGGVSTRTALQCWTPGQAGFPSTVWQYSLRWYRQERRSKRVQTRLE
jgi:hypothetical protein